MGSSQKNENHSYENLQNPQNHPRREEVLANVQQRIWHNQSKENNFTVTFPAYFDPGGYEKADNLSVNRETLKEKEHRPTNHSHRSWEEEKS